MFVNRLILYYPVVKNVNLVLHLLLRYMPDGINCFVGFFASADNVQYLYIRFYDVRQQPLII